MRYFFDPSPEQQVVVLVNDARLRKAERLIEMCENWNEEGAEIPFDNILDHVTGSDPRVTDYILEEPGKCPIYIGCGPLPEVCSAPLTIKTRYR